MFYTSPEQLRARAVLMRMHLHLLGTANRLEIKADYLERYGRRISLWGDLQSAISVIADAVVRTTGLPVELDLLPNGELHADCEA